MWMKLVVYERLFIQQEGNPTSVSVFHIKEFLKLLLWVCL